MKAQSQRRMMIAAGVALLAVMGGVAVFLSGKPPPPPVEPVVIAPIVTPPPVIVSPPVVEVALEDAGLDELAPLSKNPVKPPVAKPNPREAECVVDARWKKSIESDLRELSKVVAAKMDTTLFGTYTKEEDAVVEKAELARTNAECVAVEGRVNALMKKYGNQ